MSDSLQPHGPQPIRLLHPWEFPGKNTGVGCHPLLQGIFLTQRSNSCLLHWQTDSLTAEPPRLPMSLLGCHNRKPKLDGSKNKSISHSPGTWKSKIKMPSSGWISVGTPLLEGGWPPSLRVLTWPLLHVNKKSRESSSVSSSSSKDTNPMASGPHP